MASSITWASILAVGVLVGILVFLFGGVMLIVLGVVMKREPGRGEEAEARCGSCGYIVLGLERMECPECGNDLREVGIERPKARRRGGMIVMGSIVVTLALLMFVGAGVYMFVGNTQKGPTVIRPIKRTLKTSNTWTYTKNAMGNTTSTRTNVTTGMQNIDQQVKDMQKRADDAIAESQRRLDEIRERTRSHMGRGMSGFESRGMMGGVMHAELLDEGEEVEGEILDKGEE
ncbi:hypothetical protein JD969_06120 [Planctomycetota bacterium]|nr:hypothetical protein JD969_06120 [Planctomycetota bacterium]